MVVHELASLGLVRIMRRQCSNILFTLIMCTDVSAHACRALQSPLLFVCGMIARDVPRFCCDARNMYMFCVLGCREHASLCDREARAPARLAQHGIHAMAVPRPGMHIGVRRWRAAATN